MKKILILEDKEIHRNVLKQLLQELDIKIQIYEAATVEQAYKVSLEEKVDVFLVDIILNTKVRGDVSGLRFMEQIRKLPHYFFTPLIFITSLEDPLLYAYKNLHCFGYVEKPFDKEEVKRLVRQALTFADMERVDKTFYFRSEGVIYAVDSRDIIYIENVKRKIVIHTQKEQIVVPYMTNEKLIRELGSDNFVQCSRFCIVHKKYIETIDYVNRYIRLKGIKEPVEIGITMKKRLKETFANLS